MTMQLMPLLLDLQGHIVAEIEQLATEVAQVGHEAVLARRLQPSDFDEATDGKARLTSMAAMVAAHVCLSQFMASANRRETIAEINRDLHTLQQRRGKRTARRADLGDGIYAQITLEGEKLPYRYRWSSSLLSLLWLGYFSSCGVDGYAGRPMNWVAAPILLRMNVPPSFAEERKLATKVRKRVERLKEGHSDEGMLIVSARQYLDRIEAWVPHMQSVDPMDRTPI